MGEKENIFNKLDESPEDNVISIVDAINNKQEEEATNVTVVSSSNKSAKVTKVVINPLEDPLHIRYEDLKALVKSFEVEIKAILGDIEDLEGFRTELKTVVSDDIDSLLKVSLKRLKQPLFVSTTGSAEDLDTFKDFGRNKRQ